MRKPGERFNHQCKRSVTRALFTPVTKSLISALHCWQNTKHRGEIVPQLLPVVSKTEYLEKAPVTWTIPVPVPRSYWAGLRIFMIFSSFAWEFSFHKPVLLIPDLFVSLSVIAYVPAPPSTLPGEGFGVTGSAFCALYRAETGWRRGTRGVAAG